jgi:hypothetical protein
MLRLSALSPAQRDAKQIPPIMREGVPSRLNDYLFSKLELLLLVLWILLKLATTERRAPIADSGQNWSAMLCHREIAFPR